MVTGGLKTVLYRFAEHSRHFSVGADLGQAQDLYVYHTVVLVAVWGGLGKGGFFPFCLPSLWISVSSHNHFPPCFATGGGGIDSPS